jgi:hypothetical protein
MDSKQVLKIVGILLIIMGGWSVLALYMPSLPTFGVNDPLWHGILKIAIGIWAFISAK